MFYKIIPLLSLHSVGGDEWNMGVEHGWNNTDIDVIDY